MKNKNLPAHSTDIGLTKREYAAIAAMQGFLANSNLTPKSDEQLSEACVIIADLLFKELEKTTTN
jgi:hypothetical protein